MKKIKYRQYYYGNDYSNGRIILPDTCNIYQVDDISTRTFFVKEHNTWAKSYILIDTVKFKDATKIGDIYFSYLSNVIIFSDTVLDISDIPKIENVYFFTYCRRDSQSNESFFKELVNIPSNYTQEDLIKILNKTTKIASINKLRRFTSNGIEYTSLWINDLLGNNPVKCIELSYLDYSKVNSIDFSTSEESKDLYNKTASDLYQLLILNS